MSKAEDFFPPVNICRLSECKQCQNLSIIRGPTMINIRPISSRCQGFNLKSSNNNVYVCASTVESEVTVTIIHLWLKLNHKFCD